jgi:hypothetical protein
LVADFCRWLWAIGVATSATAGQWHPQHLEERRQKLSGERPNLFLHHNHV